MISVDQLTVEFGGFQLFNDVSFMVNPKDRIGLVGKNGSGKSTLLKIFMRMQTPAKGKVTVPERIRLGYLPQHMSCKDSKTVIEETREAFFEVLLLEKKIREINHHLTNRTDYESSEYLKLIHDLTEATDQYQMMGGGAIDADIEQTLFGLGFQTKDFNRQTSEFSGGWRMRIELAKILLQKPDVLLLDEPTNHLDIEAIQWFEDFLINYPGALVLISHDRMFLDNVTKRTVELSLGKAYDYNVPYSKYVVLRKERREQQMAAYRNQQKMIEETEDFIERFRYKATKAVQVQSRIKQLDKIDRIEVDEEDLASLNIKFPPAPRSGDVVITARDLSKNYGDLVVFKEVDLTIHRGDRVAFVGRNGEGKTTLSKIIVDNLEHGGTLKIGHNVSIGYFAQNQDEIMDEKKTVFQTIDDIAVGDVRTKIRDILGAFLFSGEDIDKKIKVLSGGERSRLAMAKLLLQPYNLLVLDEPTNHLDMRSKDILKEALLDYKGTLILVSHDREFLDGLVDKVYEFKNQKVKEHLGGIFDFLQKRKLENLKELERKNTQQALVKDKKESDNKMAYLEKKEIDKQIRKIENSIKTSEENIDKFEKEIEKIAQLMSDPKALGENPLLFKDYEMQKQNLQKEMSKWESFHKELEILMVKKEK
ncbi:MAG: glycosyl transferase family 2 [Bacteroidetes bacterium GWC2_33_15]|nr:MAG: glycosyl transferase family 2 [Bacteroidetes bacterium GWA2_33_15]OFX50412.1 MAG: glycosyl transferase family 2 [Bacteroidetes bacterium GWC2_33_15]OFX66670.1 MAG: glycosyl transferase family 2 [Bacteroidetes bacterium GWB2_32_14]OFX69288.1 MAG: glycosyl transferase family 2 [Bacteroidetes bacterium GWD2_33_33]HAN18603.1 glycosyl transferase family 2 [Bacteroidales bacterium]